MSKPLVAGDAGGGGGVYWRLTEGGSRTNAAVCAGTCADQVAENALRLLIWGHHRIWWARCVRAQAPVRHHRGDPRQVRAVAHREARSERQCRCQRCAVACGHAGDCSSLLSRYVTLCRISLLPAPLNQSRALDSSSITQTSRCSEHTRRRRPSISTSRGSC